VHWGAVGVSGISRLLANLRFDARARPGGDIESQRALPPPGVAVELPHGVRFFTGREAALGAITAWRRPHRGHPGLRRHGAARHGQGHDSRAAGRGCRDPVSRDPGARPHAGRDGECDRDELRRQRGGRAGRSRGRRRGAKGGGSVDLGVDRSARSGLPAISPASASRAGPS